MTEDFKAYKWQLRYSTSALNDSGDPTNILHDFYIPALKRAVRYDRMAGYFRSTSLAAASQGYTAFLNNGGNMRLIVGADLQLQDVAAILSGDGKKLSDSLMKELEGPEKWPEEVQNGVALLGAMVASRQLEVKVAFRINALTHKPISVDSTEDGYVHEKWLIMEDANSNRIYGSGSLNESRTALSSNAENIDINCDWEGRNDKLRTDLAESGFEDLWNNRNPHMVTMPVPDAVKERLIQLKDLRGKPTEIDGTVLKEIIPPSPMEMLRFAVLKDAPRMPGGIYVGMYSAPVEPWPHQEIVSKRLIESWPYSYMLCDEVGLGKTIEAALAIRSLILSGRAKRVLIIAPKSLTDQWHRELAAKAMLPFYKTTAKPGPGGKLDHGQIYPYEEGYSDTDMYSPSYNIVSSGLVSRKERRKMLAAADGCDVILVDEAHYARRKNPRGHSAEAPKYGNLYTVLKDQVTDKAKSLWLATATPMQIDPIEVYDLFRLAGRSGAFLADPTLSMEYFDMSGMIAKGEGLSDQHWSVLGQSFAQIKALDPFLWDILERTTITNKNRRVLKDLAYRRPKNADVKYLKQPLFAASPLSRVMMRHSRKLLEIYRRNGELTSNLAKRNVRPICAIEFTPDEKAFYDLLGDYCRGLEDQVRQNNPQARQVMNFLLNFLQLRFASSLYAIQQTLIRRLRRVNYTLAVGARTFDSQEELEEALSELEDVEGASEEYSEGDLDDITLDALLKDRSVKDLKWEREELQGMIALLDTMKDTPSKMKALLEEIERRRSGMRVRQTVIFTRFYDTLKSIRDHLQIRAPGLHVGIYSGGHAEYYDPMTGKDVGTSHTKIKDLFLDGEIDILLCTDAAAEGLNLQTADLLINFDLGWNPMKVEQRIGRIDRIGQKYKAIEVMNMAYLGSTEEIVYGRLFDRLSKAGFVVGTQQVSLLPVTAEDFRALSDGRITLDDLEKVSREKLRRQKESTESMEIPAEEMYEMYRKQSRSMQKADMPARLPDIRDALVSSRHLKSLGLTVNDDLVSLPAGDDTRGFKGTFNREDIDEDCPFMTWGNADLDAVFESMAKDIGSLGCIRRITVHDGDIEYVGYAVAGVDGPILITSYGDLDGISIDESYQLTDTDIAFCKERLKGICEQDINALELRKRAKKDNDEFARIHERLIRCAAAGVLKQLEENGNTRFSDALKTLDNETKEIYSVQLPADFIGKGSKLLFPLINPTTAPRINVYGLLLTIVSETIKRSASGIKKKKSDIMTSEVIRRLERRS